MRRTVLLLFILWPLWTGAQLVEWYGYYEPQLYVSRLSGHTYQTASNKARFDFSVEHGRYTVSGNLNAISYHGQTSYALSDFMPGIFRSNPSFDPVLSGMNITFHDTLALDNAFIRARYDWGDITFGKQQLSFGTGYAWNPTDIFNTKEITDPTYEQPGHNALRLDVPIRFNASQLVVVYQPEHDFKHSGYLFSLKSRLFHFDCALSMAHLYWRLTDLTTLDFTLQRRLMTGFNVVGELFGLGVWSEMAHSQMQTSNDFTEWVTGANYTLTNQLYVMLEYYYHSLGKNNHHDFTINDWIRYYSSELKAIARHQTYLFLQYPVTDLIMAQLSIVSSWADNSHGIIPGLQFSLSDYTEATIIAQLNTGKSGTAYDYDLGRGVLFRLRSYF